MGNAFYGGTGMDKSKHTSLKFCDEEKIHGHIRHPLFKTLEELNNGIYEVEKTKKKVYLDSPVQIMISVYSYAKILLISFWEFLNKYLDNELYQLLHTDTDSLYIAFARESIDECVKVELREEWNRIKWDFLSSEDKSEMDFEGHAITKEQFDKRTPGKFKPEFKGDGEYALNSKVFHIWKNLPDGTVKSKISCKGTQKSRNDLGKEHFSSVLDTKEPYFVKNVGFIKDNLTLKTYTQTKVGLSHFYAKRKVLADGIHTTHLDI